MVYFRANKQTLQGRFPALRPSKKVRNLQAVLQAWKLRIQEFEFDYSCSTGAPALTITP
jgi:hypothetical protein